MTRVNGYLAVLSSALLFGLTPVLARTTYDLGSNAVMLTFLRGLFAIPILILVLVKKRISLRITARELRDILIAGFFGSAPTPLLLYSAYYSMPVGLATVLHFLFPVIVAVTGVLLFKTRLKRNTIVALLFCMAGLVFFAFGSEAVLAPGFILSLLSAVSYSIYILGVERSSLSRMHALKISLYLSSCSVLFSFLFALFTGTFVLDMEPLAWGISFILSLLVAVAAFSLFQIGIKRCGAAVASILSTLETLTGVLAGYLFLNE